jgi:hypothetical protein
MYSMMEGYYLKKDDLEIERHRRNYHHIPNWARTLIELYKSPLKYEVMYEREKEQYK